MGGASRPWFELPALNTQVLERSEVDSLFRTIAEEEVALLRTLAETYPDEAMIGLAKVAAAAFVDTQTAINDRRSAICYLAINISAKLEDPLGPFGSAIRCSAKAASSRSRSGTISVAWMKRSNSADR